METPLKEVLQNVEQNLRNVDSIRSKILEDANDLKPHQAGCVDILEEVFADLTTVMYLMSIGLIVPARLTLRRALELAVAGIYMWDLPHEYWGWVKRDDDLSFSKMLAHLSGPAYLSYLVNSESNQEFSSGLDQSNMNAHYRQLSNTVHGKFDSLPPVSPDRYQLSKNQALEQLRLARDVQQTIIDLWCARFPRAKAALAPKVMKPRGR